MADCRCQGRRQSGPHSVKRSGEQNRLVHERDMPARFRSGLKRRVVIAISVKLALLAILYLMFFSPSHRLAVDDAAVDRHLLPNR